VRTQAVGLTVSNAQTANPTEAECQAMGLWYPDGSQWPQDTPLLAQLAAYSDLAAKGRADAFQQQMLRETLPEGWQRSMAELVIRQWQVARRQSQAAPLEALLGELSAWMAAPVYLRRLRQAGLLRWLPSGPDQQPASLGQLLREAALIALIEQETAGQRLPGASEHGSGERFGRGMTG